MQNVLRAPSVVAQSLRAIKDLTHGLRLRNMAFSSSNFEALEHFISAFALQGHFLACCTLYREYRLTEMTDAGCKLKAKDYISG